MSFINTQYLPILLLVFVVFIFICNRFNAKFFSWVESYWFLKRSFTNRFSNIMYYISIMLLLLSLLDLRGPEKKIKGNLPDQKTILILDTSLSMLSEDVRPNRFGKAIQLARHFVKNSAGHQLSVVVFSDTQKRLIPFTDDIDLVDSRLAALETTNSVGGGSSIAQAISEATSYFEESSEDGAGGGNILLFTDAEESDGDFKITVPENVNLAVIGIGTSKGANIPLRWDDGSFRGYKTIKNEPVVTKLDENYIKSLGKSVKNYAYWIVNSYTLPTEEILNFLRSKYNKSHSNGDLRVRPVYSYYILIPAILTYVLSVLLSRFKTFKSIGVFILVLGLGLSSNQLFAKEDPLPKDVVSDLEKMKAGKSTHLHTLKTAEKLLRNNKTKESLEIYSEYYKKEDDEKVKFNYATSLMREGKIKEAMSVTNEILKTSKNESLKNKLRSNLILAINQKNENQKGQDKNQQKSQNDQQNQDQNKENQKNQDKQDQNQKSQKNQSEQNKQNQDQKNQGKDNPQNKQGKPQDKGDKKEEEKDKDKKDSEKKKDQGKDGEDKKDEQEENKGPQSLEEKEKQIKQKRRMSKVPGVVKQLMNDDRELQKKLMDTSTKEKGDLKPKNDW